MCRGGGTSQDDSASASVEKDESSSDGSATASDSAASSTAAAAKAAPTLEDADSVTKIYSASDFADLKNGGTYQLASDITVNDTVFVSANTTLDLNGHKINYTGNSSLFHVQSNGALTITDSQHATDSNTEVSGEKYGNEASISYSNGVPTQLTYYVTESTPNSDKTNTTETLYQHTVTPGGVITATNGTGANSVIYMDGGTLNVQGGTICMPNSGSHGSDCHIINVEAGTFNLSGGYIVGGQRTSNWGGGVHLSTAKGSGTTLNMTGGVIAANKAKAGAGVYAENGTTVNVSGGAISGNEVIAGTYGWSDKASDGYGAGIYAVGAVVNVSGGYITNNSNHAIYNQQGQGLVGGGGIAIMNDSSQASLSISGGYITGNYAESAGGGVYAGRSKKGLGANFTLSGGTVASNVADTSEGGGIRVSAGTTATFSVSVGSHAYITNNKCNSTFDWGGGGMFVQEGGFVSVLNALITNNIADGYGGGFAACPTGETVITHTQGAAIYGNTDAGSSDSANMSGGGHGKNMDSTVAYKSDTFRYNGHADYFLVRAASNNSYISVVTGRMRGDGAANWSGSVDGVATGTIDADSGIGAKYMVGLTAHPDDAAKKAAVSAATLTISGNYSHNHGGGIMTNGGVVLGHVENINVFPGLSLDANKALVQDGANASGQLKELAYHFVLLNSETDDQKPSWNNNGTLNYGGCTEVSNVTNKADGTIRFGASSSYTNAGNYRYYVAELPNSASEDTKTQSYDKTIYQIDADVEKTSSMKLLDITFNHYSIKSLKVTVIAKDGTKTTYTPSTTTNSDNSVSFTLTKDGDTNNKAAFTNTLKPYSTSGSFTPEVKKHVDGGEVKEFTFELYDHAPSSDGSFTGTPLQTKNTTKSDSSDAKVTFDTINYANLVDNKNFTAGKGGTETYTYYIREKPGHDNGYTYDGGYYKVDVTAQDNREGHLDTTAKYTYVAADGTETDVEDGKYPTFHNKYATSLPSAGQAGIALAYVAGAAALAYGIMRLYKTRNESRKGGDR